MGMGRGRGEGTGTSLMCSKVTNWVMILGSLGLRRVK